MVIQFTGMMEKFLRVPITSNLILVRFWMIRILDFFIKKMLFLFLTLKEKMRVSILIFCLFLAVSCQDQTENKTSPSENLKSKQKEISNLIKVENPLPNMEVTSPLKVKGEARGYWYFEADAPIVLLDKDGKKLAESYIKATGDWMTEDFVDFSGTIDFDAPDDERGYLVFKRANPSDKPENDREYRIPVLFPPK